MENSSFVLRRLEFKDAPQMAALETHCFSLPWTLAQCQGALGQSQFAAFGAFKDMLLAGYISFYHFVPEMEILNIGTLPVFRRQGIAKRLLELILQAGRKMDMQRICLEVRESNSPALALYASAGFKCVGIRKKYYPDNGENALIQVFTYENQLEL